MFLTEIWIEKGWVETEFDFFQLESEVWNKPNKSSYSNENAFITTQRGSTLDHHTQAKKVSVESNFLKIKTLKYKWKKWKK